MAVARRVTPTETLEDTLRVDDAAVPVEIRHPGRANTAGDAIVWLPSRRVLFAGDTIVAPIPYGFNSYPREWIDVLESMVRLDPASIVPGHGSAMRDRTHVERLVAMLKSVRAQAAIIANDATIANEGQASAFVSMRRTRDRRRRSLLQRWFRITARPIASSAMREARGEDIVQAAR